MVPLSVPSQYASPEAAASMQPLTFFTSAMDFLVMQATGKRRPLHETGVFQRRGQLPEHAIAEFIRELGQALTRGWGRGRGSYGNIDLSPPRC
jgi:hypothetical protein